jgi:hypothetical protein
MMRYRTLLVRMLLLAGGVVLLGVGFLVSEHFEDLSPDLSWFSIYAVCVGMVVPVGWVLAVLARPFRALAGAVLGRILGGGVTSGSAWFWLLNLHTPAHRRNDTDPGDLGTVLFIIFVLPAGCSVIGFWIGLVMAARRERRPEQSHKKQEPLDIL